MPKIIENIENKLTEEAKRQIRELGYSAVTIRSVAKACGVGVGTVYNYFSSKEELLASYMLSDWNNCIAAISEAGACAEGPEPVARCIYEQLCAFTERHSSVLRDEEASYSYGASFSQYHAMLRTQLSEPLRRFCEDEFTAQFIAEALLVWTVTGKRFDEIYGMIRKLF